VDIPPKNKPLLLGMAISNTIGYTYASNHVLFDDLITDAIQNNKTIVIDVPVVILHDVIITKPLMILYRGFISGEFTLTISASFEAGLYQVFSSSLAVVFTSNVSGNKIPQWFRSIMVLLFFELKFSVLLGHVFSSQLPESYLFQKLPSFHFLRRSKVFGCHQ